MKTRGLEIRTAWTETTTMAERASRFHVRAPVLVEAGGGEPKRRSLNTAKNSKARLHHGENFDAGRWIPFEIAALGMRASSSTTCRMMLRERRCVAS